MKAKLIKTDKDNYTLFDEKGIPIGTTPNVLSNNTFSKLSKQNCDSLFGVVDVERLAHETIGYPTDEELEKESNLGIALYRAEIFNFKRGFNKAMELNKDKLFTLEDMEQLVKSAFYAGLTKGQGKNKDFDIDKYTEKHLQQPTEIEVEIVMGDSIGISDLYTPDNNPKLDSSGCLILKRVV